MVFNNRNLSHKTLKDGALVSWCITHSGKCCNHTNRMLSKNFKVYEKKLVWHLAYLV